MGATHINPRGMREMALTFNTETRRLAAPNGKSTIMRPRVAALLVTLEQCRPGYVTKRLLNRLGSNPSGGGRLRTDGVPSLAVTIYHLRLDLAFLGARFAVMAVEDGYRLIEPVEIVGEEINARRWVA